MEFKIKDANVLIDNEDSGKVLVKNWNLCKGYVRTREGNKHIYLHQFLLGKKEGFVIDHINRNPLDNRKSNLRFCTKAQNQQNRSKILNKTSKYIGVSYYPRTKIGRNWRAMIKSKLIGYYMTEEEAAVAYNTKAKEMYAQFANINLILN